MASHVQGSVGPFEGSQEDWRSYTERLQQYFAANRRKATGNSAQWMWCSYVPANPEFGSSRETYRQNLPTTRHARTGTSPAAAVSDRAAFNFHSRSRQQGESVSAYVAELRKLSEYCQFGDTLSDMLRDRLVCGINDRKLQRRLLSEAALTYDRAFALAQALEAADKSAKELEKGSGIHAIRPQTHWQGATEKFNQQGRPCYRCGRTNHTSDACRFKESDCLHCGKKGHIAKVCRSRAKPDRRTERGRQPGKPPHHVAGEVTNGGSDDSVYMLFNVPRARSSPILVMVQLNEASLEMEVDTGATASLISDSTLKSLWSDGNPPPLHPTDVKLRTYTGEELKVLGSLGALWTTKRRNKPTRRSWNRTKFARSRLVETNSTRLAGS